jgi:hypothetical protein
MCYINWRPEELGYDAPEPGFRPSPRLVWALPVDIVELGASLESFSTQLKQNTTLRLCHRFGEGPLSKLPQEILDQVISHAHEAMKKGLRSKWNQNYMCYQGRCFRSHHYGPGDPVFEEIWSYVAANLDGEDRPVERDYTEEERMVMVHEYLDDDGNDSFDDFTWEEHFEQQQAWVHQVCTCKDAKKTNSGFGHLNEVSGLMPFVVLTGGVPISTAIEVAFRTGCNHSP